MVVRVLIVKLSSLGDIVHALPVVADIRAAHAQASIDWVVEPAFAPILARTDGIDGVIECSLRRWRAQGWLRRETGQELRGFVTQLRRERYDAIVDLQGLTKSALVARIARGPRWGLANGTDGSSHEWPARALATHAVEVEPHSHAVDRSRELVRRALGTSTAPPPRFGLAACDRRPADPRRIALLHGTSRDDKLWPEADWIALGARLVAAGFTIALPNDGALERARAERIARAVGASHCEVWPPLALGDVVDRLAATGGAIGVDSGPSHLATALDLPHVQIYNHPTAWRTGPQVRHGHRHQVSVEGRPTPDADAVWAAWQAVTDARQAAPAASDGLPLGVDSASAAASRR